MLISRENDINWMKLALQQARLAAQADEVPVGAVLVDEAGNCIATGHNQPITTHDPTAHAEIGVLRQAARKVQNYRIPNTTLYVTLEPCTMCVGAIVQARVARVVYAAREPKAGAIESAQTLFKTARFNHVPTILGGILEEESAGLLSDFFKSRREAKKSGEDASKIGC